MLKFYLVLVTILREWGLIRIIGLFPSSAKSSPHSLFFNSLTTKSFPYFSPYQ